MILFKTLNTSFTGIRASQGTLFPVAWKVSIQTLLENEDARPEVAYQQMIYWLSALIDSVIIGNVNDEFFKDVAALSDNEVMTLPSDPTDEILAHALIEKLNTIGKSKGVIVIGLSLESEGVTCNIRDYSSDGSVMPDISYAGKKAKKQYNAPWWSRLNSETSDFIEDASDTLTIPELDILNRFGTEIEKRLYPEEETVQAAAKVIQPEWNKKD